MKKLSAIGMMAAVALTTSASAQEVTLILDKANQEIISGVMGHFQQKSELMKGLTIDTSYATDKSDLSEVPGALVYIHSDKIPKTETVNSILDPLRRRKKPATLMLFFEKADDFTWLSQVQKPDNVKIIVAIREFDSAEVMETYEALGVTYSGSGVKYAYGMLAEAALAQIEPKRQVNSQLELKSWSADLSSLTVFDSVGVSSGASPTVRAEFLKKVYNDKGLMSATAPKTGGVTVWPAFDHNTLNDIVAVARAVAIGECAGDWKWDGRVDAGMSFQSLGQ